MADARAILADYPDLRAAVQDVKLFSSSAFKNAAARPEPPRAGHGEARRSTPQKVMVWMKANGQVHRRGHQRREPQPGAAGAHRPRPRRRPGRGRARHRDRARAARRRRAGDEVQGGERAVRRVAAGRPAEPRPAGGDRRAGRARDAAGSWSSCGTLATAVDRAQGPATIERYNRQRQIGIQCNLAPGRGARRRAAGGRRRSSRRSTCRRSTATSSSARRS